MKKKLIIKNFFSFSRNLRLSKFFNEKNIKKKLVEENKLKNINFLGFDIYIARASDFFLQIRYEKRYKFFCEVNMLIKNNLETKFSSIVKKNKFKNALIFPEGRKITFDQLDRRSNIIAEKFLVQKNLNSRICIYSDKNEFVFYLILACLKVGKSYTVLDVDAPINRNKKILTTLNPGLLFNLTNKKFLLKKKIINKNL